MGSQKKGTDGRDDILVPLTSSLYVKGKMADREKVLVDVGTGFYVEKVCSIYSPFLFFSFLVGGLLACSRGKWIRRRVECWFFFFFANT